MPFLKFFPSTTRSHILLVMFALLTLRPMQGKSESTDRLFTLRANTSSRSVADVQVEFVAKGHLKTPGDGKAKEVDMHVSAQLEFQDRFLGEASPDGVDSSLCAGRFYHNVDVEMTVGDQTMRPVFRDTRKLMGVFRKESGCFEFFCPDGPLTRDELDLVRLPGDRQALPYLLPDNPVRIGATWKLEPQTMVSILGLDTVGHCDVQSTLTRVEDGFARVAFEGAVHGAVAGVATEVNLRGRYYFYLKHGQFATFQMVTREQRNIGHINPGVDVTAKLKMRLEPQSDAGNLSDSKVFPLRNCRESDRGKLSYQSPELGLTFDYDASWYATAEDRQAVVFRQLSRGELIAQCNVSKLPKIKTGKALTLNQFEKDIRETLGKNFGSFVEAHETTSERGYLIYRVKAIGTASSLPVQWIYYLLSDSTGRRLALVFTMERDQVKHFNNADEDWIRSLEFLPVVEAKSSERKGESNSVAPIKPPVS